MNIQDLVMQLLQEYPHATNEEIAKMVRMHKPGSNTTAASVSSIKSRAQFSSAPIITMPVETDEEAEARISVRYTALTRMTQRIAEGSIRSLIISGPPGLGKSYAMHEALQNVQLQQMLNDETSDATDWIGGGISAVGLYKALYRCADGGLLVLDDCDEIFRDEVSLNLLKVALDTGTRRVISWRRESNWLNGAEEIPDTFDFNGRVCFITNIDFEGEIQRGKRDAEHFKALIDRSMYLCLTLRSTRDFMIRINGVSAGESGMLQKNFGLDEKQARMVMEYVEQHKDRFYNLSLRLVGQIAQCLVADPDGWMDDIEATKMRTLS